uniref:Beta-adaptin-like protein n=1 Tax=Tetraselmis chuii TaxID=63592 RepID=A0A7S1T750_9CHLO|mmetsp:Transcript_7674/g.13802  ORF Transcript_7674/g.13802 Transcript_7674/m.13802 type:complete len:936 (+) Transcript_7674:163-2970(+)|eukprot:CAMPEP_0177762548 /NCGR_PEP_ID=MMETSP0491_2-20121128/6405_1 /TAXON_ID=63592 /ORGANISM="Tetraselmis chuii, Strain PLY429" /LENGTH=935 /DNA_ID=CAMNT_0019278613 /DNA_START=111 /DNA_END=2918 /DNA_ORIENTATION=+
MSDAKYFTTTKKGEIHELKEELRNADKSKKKDAVKKVIAFMTVGKDVSMLFPDLVNCMQTEDLELKKLVYLYLINYAKSQPDLCILAVNTFVKDSQDPNPLIRSLAVRTMGCIRVDKITEYLCDPLQRCLKDEDPYVRKTAAVCVAKLHDINAELVEDRGFLDALQEMLADSNPMVVANAVAALAEIQESSGRDVFKVTSTSLFKLLAALNECTEWGQVFILDSLVNYTARDSRDAESIVERVTPRLQHANCAVVLSAVKVIMKQMELIQNQDTIRMLQKKMAPPLVTLLSAEPEIQYVALRNINLIVQRRKEILAHEVKVFFCKYNDPVYVKLEKLEVMIKLANERNIDQVLLEFKEYATEVDVDFVRKAVRAIGRCAVSLERAAERCINVLLELIQTKVNYVVQEAIIVIKDIFRRYPNQYESIIGTLCENLDTLDEPEAKASMIWIIGEYAERIDNADELLETFLETFPEEVSSVQLQLLTATVKLFLKKPTEGPQQMIQLVLSNATQETDNPDLRDRAYIYWRLLSTDPEAAKEVVLAEKPVINDDTNNLDPKLLNELLDNIGTLASVYHKPPDTFISQTRLAVARGDDLETHRFEGSEDGTGRGRAASNGSAANAPAPPNLDDILGDLGGSSAPVPVAPPAQAPAGDNLLGDLLDLDTPAPAPPPAPAADPNPAAAPVGGDMFDMFGDPAPAAVPAGGAPRLPEILDTARGKGLRICGRVSRAGGAPVYKLELHNSSAGPVSGLMIQFNKNSFGLVPAAQNIAVGPIAPGASATVDHPLAINAAQAAPGPAKALLQVAIKTTELGVLYLNDDVSLEPVLEENCGVDSQLFIGMWRSLPETNESSRQLSVTIGNAEAAAATLKAKNLFLMAHRQVPGTGQDAMYLAGLAMGAQVLVELKFVSGNPGVQCSCKCEKSDLAPLMFPFIQAALQ